MLHVSRWGPEDAKNRVRVRKLRFLSLTIVLNNKCFFSLSLFELVNIASYVTILCFKYIQNSVMGDEKEPMVGLDINIVFVYNKFQF